MVFFDTQVNLVPAMYGLLFPLQAFTQLAMSHITDSTLLREISFKEIEEITFHY